MLSLAVIIAAAPSVWVDCGYHSALADYETCDLYVATASAALNNVEITGTMVATDGGEIPDVRGSTSAVLASKSTGGPLRFKHIAPSTTRYGGFSGLRTLTVNGQAEWRRQRRKRARAVLYTFEASYDVDGRRERVVVSKDAACSAQLGCRAQTGIMTTRCVCRPSAHR
jgi:hypothetical protein